MNNNTPQAPNGAPNQTDPMSASVQNAPNNTGTNSTTNAPNDKSKRNRTIIIILIILLVVMAALFAYMALRPTPTAVITTTNEQLTDSDKDNQMRIKINPYITVENGTMQDMSFFNLNKGRLMQCKIKVGDAYIYQSQYISPGEIITADVIDTGKLKPGKNKALAEIYSCDEQTKEVIGHSNVEIELDLK